MKSDIFADMFIRAINWGAVNKNTDAIAAVLLKDNGSDGAHADGEKERG